MQRIFAEAERLGVRIELGPVFPWERGRYYDDFRLIHINGGLTVKQMRATCWHELAHAYYRDQPGHDSSIEGRADRRAALMAVVPEAYARLERENDDIGFIANELGLPVRVVALWRKEWAPSICLRVA